MNQKLKNFIGLTIALIGIGLITYGGYLLLSKLWDVFSSVDPKLGAGLIAAFATIMVSLISVLVSKHIERKSAVLSQLREKKVPVYEKMMNFMFSMTMAEKLGKKKLSAVEKQAVLTEIVQELIIWGSDEMLDAFYNFRNATMQNNKNTTEGTCYVPRSLRANVPTYFA